MVVMILVPIFTVFQVSFTEVGRSGKLLDFNGVDNYKVIFADPIFWMTLRNTVIWTIVVVGISTIIGFVLAMVLNTEL